MVFVESFAKDAARIGPIGANSLGQVWMYAVTPCCGTLLILLQEMVEPVMDPADQPFAFDRFIGSSLMTEVAEKERQG